MKATILCFGRSISSTAVSPMDPHNKSRWTVPNDFEVTVKCIQGLIRMAEIENIILECIDILSTLSNCPVAFIKKTMNGAAHSLVGVAKQFDSNSWAGYVPELAASALCTNMLSINGMHV